MGLFKKNKKKRTDRRNAERPRLNANSTFAIKEAYNAIRTKLMFVGKGEKCPVFAVTSSLSGDGKTTNAVSLAVSIAMAEQKVLLIDADMRKPSVHRHFGTEAKNGLSEVLADLTNEINLRPTDCANLSILTAGQIPPNPAELLGSKQMDNLLEYVKQYFDYVIIDMPPVNIVTDATIVSDKITGYIFITQSGKNHVRDLKDAIQKIEEVNGTVVGMVLNDPYNRADAHYSYSYRKYYRYDRYHYYGESGEGKHK